MGVSWPTILRGGLQLGRNRHVMRGRQTCDAVVARRRVDGWSSCYVGDAVIGTMIYAIQAGEIRLDLRRRVLGQRRLSAAMKPNPPPRPRGDVCRRAISAHRISMSQAATEGRHPGEQAVSAPHSARAILLRRMVFWLASQARGEAIAGVWFALNLRSPLFDAWTGMTRA
ncbi:hypothetical protein FA95DRAFT_1567898 [Auriscalpium vulgare]|uniref:Uncharacterized protein n=1 Tax=Auriscalpium vulgare TaxID=40419 RepID=A0ACB8R225_9AGAM|nr:hypothetical protein FA95DRAFT_1567898 [Auriscalpium vulgare]